MEDDGAQQERDSPAKPNGSALADIRDAHPSSLGTSVNSPSKSSGLPCQVEANIEVQEVSEDPSSDSANGSLGDVGKDGVP